VQIEGTWADQYGVTLDSYIQSTYGMSRDAYIKSNMKTEMIFYALRNEIGDSVIPTDEELDDEKDTLIEYYKTYYMQNEGLTESVALTEAKDFVATLGDSYVYEQVLYTKIDNIMPSLVKTTTVKTEKDYVFDAKTGCHLQEKDIFSPQQINTMRNLLVERAKELGEYGCSEEGYA
jgi:hypothetical protein